MRLSARHFFTTDAPDESEQSTLSRRFYRMYFAIMNKIVCSSFAVIASIVLGLSPMEVHAQTQPTGDSDVVLASIEAPLTREALNEVRIAMEESGHMFHYGSFQFRQDGMLIGVEIAMKIEGQEYHDYVEFVSESCVLRIKKAGGMVMEGC